MKYLYDIFNNLIATSKERLKCLYYYLCLGGYRVFSNRAPTCSRQNTPKHCGQSLEI